jgi:hypothetical protein
MKLDCILTAVNENPLYLDFIPIFIKTWNKLYPTVDVKIVLIAHEIPTAFMEYKDNIILFPPIENVLTSFTSQYIRLLYPCILNYENGIMITDMDMLPMNRTYYTENIKEYDNNKFIYLRENVCFNQMQIAMCYNVAHANIWKSIFGINSVEDIRDRIKTVSKNNLIREGHGNVGWSIDQCDLYKNVMKWNRETNNLVCINEEKAKFKRLDRGKDVDLSNEILKKNIRDGIYSDYHCERPMSKHSKTNYEIYDLL